MCKKKVEYVCSAECVAGGATASLRGKAFSRQMQRVHPGICHSV